MCIHIFLTMEMINCLLKFADTNQLRVITKCSSLVLARFTLDFNDANEVFMSCFFSC